ncbi:MAG: hypothetical protein ACM358_05890, partial [Gemmatimonadota bacterium]
MKWDAPASWTAVTTRAVIVAVTAFVVMQAKEFIDAGAFDMTGVGMDAILIGAGVFLVNAI